MIHLLISHLITTALLTLPTLNHAQAAEEVTPPLARVHIFFDPSESMTPLGSLFNGLSKDIAEILGSLPESCPVELVIEELAQLDAPDRFRGRLGSPPILLSSMPKRQLETEILMRFSPLIPSQTLPRPVPDLGQNAGGAELTYSWVGTAIRRDFNEIKRLRGFGAFLITDAPSLYEKQDPETELFQIQTLMSSTSFLATGLFHGEEDGCDEARRGLKSSDLFQNKTQAWLQNQPNGQLLRFSALSSGVTFDLCYDSWKTSFQDFLNQLLMESKLYDCHLIL